MQHLHLLKFNLLGFFLDFGTLAVHGRDTDLISCVFDQRFSLFLIDVQNVKELKVRY